MELVIQHEIMFDPILCQLVVLEMLERTYHDLHGKSSKHILITRDLIDLCKDSMK